MSTGEGVIWRGYHHAWRYNHRLNRLGSYLEFDGDDWECVHTAASGTGPDTARFCDLYTKVAGDGVAFQSHTESFEVEGDENVPITVSKSLTSDLESPLENRDTYEVLLNGFDIYAASDADKLQELSLHVDRPTPTDGRTSLDFDASVEFRGDCGTPECREDGVDYTVEMRYLVVGGDADTVRSGPAISAGTDYAWSMSQEPDQKRDGVANATVTDSNRWTGPSVENAVGLTDVDVTLTKTGDPPLIAAAGALADHAEGMHLLEHDVAIESITTRDDRIDVEFLLFYKNWEAGMKRAVPPDFLQRIGEFIPGDTEQAIRDDPSLSWTDVIDASLFAHKSAGEATFDATARLLQFDSPDTFHHNAVPGDIDWEGENADASSSDATHTTLID
ncbi:Uncharacterized protein SVXHr_0339 [Halorhabdus sp. SVX81]|uniref:hypothetical protein n=1 Tax=Halorhabdus sp. SVX81 TaxID=2978283 RepID=UPI0023DBFE28|nr:hypothetical protein [Halorhabdus sp. SVX81]WEL16521.1 Uncharacterized protein SVXHr_0339 [Halorhabdus sp. SVX81]